MNIETGDDTASQRLHQRGERVEAIMKKEKKHIAKRILFWIAVVFMAFWMIFPFYWMINSALKTETQLQMTPATFIPRDPDTGGIAITFQNFAAVFRNAKFRQGIWNSVIVAGLTTLVSLVIGSSEK